MSNEIALNFEDGVTRFITANDGELVADAAYRLGLNIPMDCRDGACGTCKSLCESGDYTLGSYIDDALSGEEAGQRYVLTCQMKAKSNCVVKIPASSTICKVKVASFKTKLGSLRKLSPSTIGFSVALEQDLSLSFLPGQYVNVIVPNTTQSRSYSFSSMLRNGEIEFLVRNIPSGLMSTYLTEFAKSGDALTMTGPVGSFYLRDIKRPLLFLAGGTGLAPFLAMLEAMSRNGTSHPVHLIYGVNNDADLVEVDKLEAFAETIKGFTFATVIGDAASTHPLKGYVTNHLPDEHLHGGDVDIYLCGPPPMVDAVRSYLSKKRVTPANFYFEKFAPSEAGK